MYKRHQTPKETARYLRYWQEVLQIPEKEEDEEMEEKTFPTDIATNAAPPYSMETGSLAEMLDEWQADRYPMQFAQLDLLPEECGPKEEIFSAYFGIEPRPLNTYLNRDILIRGSIFYEHPTYTSHGRPAMQESISLSGKIFQAGELIPAGTVLPGYVEILFLTTMKDEDGNAIVLKSSSKVIGQHVFYIMRSKPVGVQGWYLWRDELGRLCPKTYRFTQRAAGAPMRMISVDRQKAEKKEQK